MIIVIYLIIALALIITVFTIHKKKITESKTRSGYDIPWVDHREFWLAFSMIIFPIILPAFGLSKLLMMVFKIKEKKKDA